jgi:hypothetical protein
MDSPDVPLPDRVHRVTQEEADLRESVARMELKLALERRKHDELLTHALSYVSPRAPDDMTTHQAELAALAAEEAEIAALETR